VRSCSERILHTFNYPRITQLKGESRCLGYVRVCHSRVVHTPLWPGS